MVRKVILNNFLYEYVGKFLRLIAQVQQIGQKNQGITMHIEIGFQNEKYKIDNAMQQLNAA